MQAIGPMQASGRRDPIFRAIEAMTALAEIFERRREVLARDAGITIGQWRVLEEISTQHFIPSMFARSRDSSAAAVSKILRQLLDTGLVSAAIGRADHRNRHYKLTARGNRTLGELRAAREKAIEAIWTGFSQGELAAFSKFAATLSDRIERYSRAKTARRGVAVS
jgi:DNA-binding MarR family transcriptional regulator